MESIERYKRTPSELSVKASRYWPNDIVTASAKYNVIPLLLKTQEKFICVLYIADASPDAWKSALQSTSGLPANVFLKHLMILADFGGELLKRLQQDLSQMFPTGVMTYAWRGETYEYRFKKIIGHTKLSNSSLKVDGKGLMENCVLNNKMEDIVMLILHGSAVISNSTVPEFIREKCIIGGLLGNKEEIEKFVRQRYIIVSRITGGAKANTLGQVAQNYVQDKIKQLLPDWEITRNGTIPGISQTAGKTETTFDIVAKSPKGKYVAIEVSFQVTTNSVIERKAGQAKDRAEQLHKVGHKIAYVIDGAGNFERVSALRTICEFSDCTVAFTDEEIGLLIQFLQEVDSVEENESIVEVEDDGTLERG